MCSALLDWIEAPLKKLLLNLFFHFNSVFGSLPLLSSGYHVILGNTLPLQNYLDLTFIFLLIFFK